MLVSWLSGQPHSVIMVFVCFQWHLCLWHALAPSLLYPFDDYGLQIYGVVSISTDSVSLTVLGGSLSHDSHVYMHALL